MDNVQRIMTFDTDMNNFLNTSEVSQSSIITIDRTKKTLTIQALHTLRTKV